MVSELYARLYGQFGPDSDKVGAELATVYSNLDETYQIKARLFGFTKAEVDTRLLVFDHTGRVIFDTTGAASPAVISRRRPPAAPTSSPAARARGRAS